MNGVGTWNGEVSNHTERVTHTCRIAAEHAARHDRAASFPVEALAAMRDSGLLGLVVPRQSGGLGGSLQHVVDVTMEIGRVDMSCALVFGMHCQQALVLERHATPTLRSEILPRLASGEVYLGSVTTEPGSGGHLLSSNSLTHETQNGIVIDREAPIVTGGCHADAYLITVRSSGSERTTDVDLYYAPRDLLDVVVVGTWDPMGMRATESVPMRLAGRVPASNRLGEPGRFRDIAVKQLAPVGHVVWAAAWLGTAVGALSRVITHIRRPKSRAHVDPGSDLLKSRLGSMRCTLEGVHALLHHAVLVLASSPDPTSTPVQLLLNALKAEAAERCFAVVHDLVELMGLRHGYLSDSPLQLERAFRDLRSASLNYANERLRQSCGALSLMDAEVRLA
ncbi:acyl-CoA dehydrogenase family protein [Streptomyces sp. 7N604]|uniref:acyl-CoA dehydrogenase family protein n=1 Tax=Streptomyces sp. 7N604 TaxID=3457415 RepID=UPI003FD5D77F